MIAWLEKFVNSAKHRSPFFAHLSQLILMENILLCTCIRGMAKFDPLLPNQIQQMYQAQPWLVFDRTHKGKFANKEGMLANYKADFQVKMENLLPRVEEKDRTNKRKREEYTKISCRYFHAAQEKSGKNSQKNKDDMSRAIARVLKNCSGTRASLSAIIKIQPSCIRRRRKIERETRMRRHARKIMSKRRRRKKEKKARETGARKKKWAEAAKVKKEKKAREADARKKEKTEEAKAKKEKKARGAEARKK